MAVILAFTLEDAARVAKVSTRRIRYWVNKDVLRPNVRDGKEHTPFRYVFSFQDVVALRTLGVLRDQHGITLQHLKRAGDWLKLHYEQPWANLRLGVIGKRVVFWDSKAKIWELPESGRQTVFPIELQQIYDRTKHDAERLTKRGPDDYGHIVQNRYILHNRPRIRGTRIPTSAVWDFHIHGASTDRILKAYPSLTLVDIDAAIAFEEASRQESTA